MPESVDIMSFASSHNDIHMDAVGQKPNKMSGCVDDRLDDLKRDIISAIPKHSEEENLKKMPIETGASPAPSSMTECGAADTENSGLENIKESGCSYAVTESSICMSATVEESRTQKSSMKSCGGARPKTTSSSATKKGVTWSEETSTKTCIDDHAFEQYRDLLKALRVEDELFNCPGVKATKSLLDTEIEQSPELFEIAAKMLRVKHNRFPSGQELFQVFMNYNEMQIVTAFIEACQTEEGNSVVKSLQLRHEPQNNYKQQEDDPKVDHPEEMSQGQCENNMEINETQTSLTETENAIPTPQKERDFHEMSLLALRQEQKYLKKSLTCVLCEERPAEVTLLPCGHFVLCARCSDTCYVCPVCHKTALGEVKTYLG